MLRLKRTDPGLDVRAGCRIGRGVAIPVAGAGKLAPRLWSAHARGFGRNKRRQVMASPCLNPRESCKPGTETGRPLLNGNLIHRYLPTSAELSTAKLSPVKMATIQNQGENVNVRALDTISARRVVI